MFHNLGLQTWLCPGAPRNDAQFLVSILAAALSLIVVDPALVTVLGSNHELCDSLLAWRPGYLDGLKILVT